MASRTNIFNTIRSEGAILPADLLQRIASGDKTLQGLRPEDYHLAPGERLNEAATRSWNRLRGVWETFKNILEKLSEESIGTTETRERWLTVLFQELGYGRLQAGRALDIDGRTYPISHHANEPIAVHLVSFRQDLDRRTPGRAGAARVSPHSLVQEFLNRHEEYLWGILSNGLKLRILRDNVSLTRVAYVEFDLQAMMDGDAYSDFFLLFLLCHQSRVEVELVESGKPRPPETCWLEKWYNTAVAEGVRALDALRTGVEKAIETLGGGFLAHPANGVLREQLRSGELTTLDYYRQVLRQVYRLLFLFVAEDRDLLAPSDTPQQIKEIYKRYYSSSRLRELAGRKRGTRHGDLWQQLNLIFAKLYRGCPELGLPSLGSYLFKAEATEALNNGALTNVDLLAALRNLSYTSKNNVLQPVNYRNLGPEELGSVYESLLEMHPDIHLEAAQFKLNVSAGSERKTTGSYYTPTSLVNCLLDSALEPVIAQAIKGKNFEEQEQAILNLKVCDPACGSGHFLIAAAHRLAKRLAGIRAREEEPAPTAIQHALRDVISRCIYGVDINPMSVELCKVSLWMEAMEPGKPLAFLDHHIQCGNSLLGCTPALLKRGIPEEAFKPIEGDDKEFCSVWKKKNKAALKGQHDLFIHDEAEWNYHKAFEQAVRQLDTFTDDSLSEIERKESAYHEYLNSSSYQFGKRLYDAWCSAFVWKKLPSEELPYPITQQIIREMRRDPHRCPGWMANEIDRLADEYQFFHWHVAFPEVFQPKADDEIKIDDATGWIGGFDCVLGNPPWERIKIQEKEWFAERDPEIANAQNTSARRRLISELKQNDDPLYFAFRLALRRADGESQLLRSSGRYPLCGRGDLNTYPLFAELKRSLLNSYGYVACIVPSGIATDNTTQYFFKDLCRSKSLVSICGFINEEMLFPAVLHNFKFCLLVMAGEKIKVDSPDFVFNCYNIEHVADKGRHFSLTDKDIELLNPNTGTCPVFFWAKSAEITKFIYRKVPILCHDSIANEWDISLSTMFHMSNDSKYFEIEPFENSLPLYEAKMMHQFNHRFASYEHLNAGDRTHMLPECEVSKLEDPNYVVSPCYYVADHEAKKRLEGKYPNRWLMGYREITSAGLYRTTIYSALPLCGVSNKIPLVSFGTKSIRYARMFLGCMNSLILDFCSRQKLGGASFSFFIKKQIPVLQPSTYDKVCPWDNSLSLMQWIESRILELCFTAWDMEAFAQDSGIDCPPFIWDEGRRFEIRCELDAIFFHLYLGTELDWGEQGNSKLLSMFPFPRQAVEYVLETFPIVKRKDEQKYGQYRTKNHILEIYDEMAECMANGTEFKSSLNPPPGPPVNSDGSFLSMYQWDRHDLPAHIHPPHSDWDESLLSAWYSVCQKRWKYLDDDQIFPWDGREAYTYAIIPYLVQELPGEKFEFYRDAALLSVQVSHCETLLLEDKTRSEYRQIMNDIDWLAFPSTHRIHPSKIRETLQKKKLIETDPSSGVTTILRETKFPPLPKALKPILPLALKAAGNLDKLQRQALEKSEARKISFTADEIAKELNSVMAA